MEPVEVKKRGRGRPRKRRQNEDENDKKVGSAIKKQALDLWQKPLVGRYVLKEFEANGIFLGKIVNYDTGLYRVDYEDGDFEDLDSGELRSIILGDGDFDDDLSVRRSKLDQLVSNKILKKKEELEKKELDMKNEVDKVETPALSEPNGEFTVESNGIDGEGDADSSSDSYESLQDRDLEAVAEAPVVPPPQLPPSSGTVGVPEQFVSHIFSVYAFLRSFNICLFLSPFTLDDLVGAINCCVQNTLMDSIHVALMRALKRHLETLSSEGSELASKCLGCTDWSLLDSFTWPTHLVYYFSVMGHVKGPEWKGFYDDLLKREYYSLPVGRKLMILQVLCDDVLNTVEVRTEIDMHVESEVGVDPDAVMTNLPENGPRRVHPKYSKTSACKDKEAMEIIGESNGTKPSHSSKYLGSKVSEGNADAPDADIDGNGDECRLCGMDGTLLCCDACPSVYHSRCIGVVKMYIPEGKWYCPECTINRLGPTIAIGTSLKGAKIFGVDSYEQVFFGTCDHLLVASVRREPCLRYYNQKDIPKVLQTLVASGQHGSLYLEISKAIAWYWHIPETVFSPFETIEKGLNMASVEEDGKVSAPLLPSLREENNKVPDTFEPKYRVTSTGSTADSLTISCVDASSNAIQADLHTTFSDGDAARTQSCNVVNMMLSEQIKMESTGSISQQADPSVVSHQSMVNRRSLLELTECAPVNSDGSHSGHANGNCLPAIISSQSKEGNHASFGRFERNSMMNCVYLGTSFKPYAYINHYMHGDFAASAAASLAFLSSEESRSSEVHRSLNARKGVSDISLQTKAFSMVASRFFWPSSERKLMEVPRERCGWCYSCKLQSNSRRGCMLNAAALTATKGAMKILTGLRPILSGEGSLRSISTYILYMGEVLCGLTVVSFLSTSSRQQWRTQLENASNYSEVKGSLLELEENIRNIALSGDWVKAMDDWLVESSVIQGAASTTSTTQKRGPGGKRCKKQSVIPDITADSRDKTFTWWRGGNLLNHVFHKAILPQSVVKRAARQGGSRKIMGVHYGDDFEIPKRSKQLVWRAAVESCKNASQLALQVRYLDLHIRWSDLVRPEQNLQDGKGPETEASVFRNAIICDKKVNENKIKYGVAFGGQKHLPSRVMKNIIEIEQFEDGKEKYWFSETNVPLYLIKEFEETVDKVVWPSTKKPVKELSNLQKSQLKASRRDIFLYLTCKRDKLDKCFCASCHCDVFLRDAVNCSACEGYCHKYCTVSSTIYTSGEAEYLITCQKCCDAKNLSHNHKSNASPISTLPLQGREYHIVTTVNKGPSFKAHNQPVVSVGIQENWSNVKQANLTSVLASKSKSKRKLCNWGVIWKKKNIQDTGAQFRQKNILLRGNSDKNGLRPICNLCKKDYDSDLIYIHCETCNHWFHAEAVELEESKLSSVVGFKCCRCRRIRPPKCPYKDDFEFEKPEVQKPRKKALKQGNIGVDSDSGIFAEFKEHKPTTPVPLEKEIIQEDDPLLFSVSGVEQITEQDFGVDFEWNSTGQGPQKLPVRRQGRHQRDNDGISRNYLYHSESSVPLETSNLNDPQLQLSSGVEWDVSANGLEDVQPDNEGFSYEGMEYEPQTYFSFTELLAPDDDLVDGLDASGNVLENNENQSFAVLQDQVPAECAIGTFGAKQDSMASQSNINTRHCKMCSFLEPVPDLFCEICGLVIHHQCSPWVESPYPGNSWRCGNCREWR